MMEWYELKNADRILTPALALYPKRINYNIEKMIKIAGNPDRLRPHVKTYKMPQIVQMQMDKGIKKFKCATLMEAKMLAETGVKDVLLAMPLTGPNQLVFRALKKEFPKTNFSTLVDSEEQVKQWKILLDHDKVALYIDINVGMGRTGIFPEKAATLAEVINSIRQFELKGLHIYDGHIRTSDLTERSKMCNDAFEKVNKLIEQMHLPDQELICGGSATFPIHAKYKGRTLSPGTTLLWDAGYNTHFPDIPMQNAAVLLSRIISKPGEDRICLDLGHKSVASEMQDKRVHFPQLTNYKRVGHSEEHLVCQVDDRDKWNIGDLLYGIPWHICPTVALHNEVLVVKNHQVFDIWKVEARGRKYML